MAHTTDKRIRGSRLMKIRAAHTAVSAWCEHCLKKDPPVYTLWTQLDHKRSLEYGGVDSKNPFVNRQRLCTPCHDRSWPRGPRP